MVATALINPQITFNVCIFEVLGRVNISGHDDNYSQMIFGDLGGLKLPDICLTGEENPEKTSPRKLVPTGDKPGPAA